MKLEDEDEEEVDEELPVWGTSESSPNGTGGYTDRHNNVDNNSNNISSAVTPVQQQQQAQETAKQHQPQLQQPEQQQQPQQLQEQQHIEQLLSSQQTPAQQHHNGTEEPTSSDSDEEDDSVSTGSSDEEGEFTKVEEDLGKDQPSADRSDLPSEPARSLVTYNDLDLLSAPNASSIGGPQKGVGNRPSNDTRVAGKRKADTKQPAFGQKRQAQERGKKIPGNGQQDGKQSKKSLKNLRRKEKRKIQVSFFFHLFYVGNIIVREDDCTVVR